MMSPYPVPPQEPVEQVHGGVHECKAEVQGDEKVREDFLHQGVEECHGDKDGETATGRT